MLAEYTRWKNWLKKIPGLVSLVRLYHIVSKPSYRSEWQLQRSRPDKLFQPYGYTVLNRYPRIFSTVKEKLFDIAAPRLLSFGCSTGEEVFTLRSYFPQGEIVGIDINPRSIEHCRKQLRKKNDSRIRFELAASPEAVEESLYDAIFCMAVLRHGELGASRVDNCSMLIRFADFERIVTDLCRCLKPGGYFVIRHSNFRFSDTEIASEFDIVFSIETRDIPAKTPIYDKNNRLLNDAVNNDVIFRKRKNPRISP